MNFKRSLIKYTAALSIFFAGISVINVPAATVQADDADTSESINTNDDSVVSNDDSTASIETSDPSAKTVKTKSSVAKKRDAVVKLAKEEVGKPYVWGATGPYSFDCSGLVQYVYRHAGKKYLPRTTYAQVNFGKRVSLRHLKKGDLLFWGSASAPYHVGIYIGKGKYVHAATPSQGVKKSSLHSGFYPAAAKRILN